jgi:hypothetical protein
MKKLILYVLAVTLLIAGCRKGTGQTAGPAAPDSTASKVSAKAVNVLEEYLHRIGSGDINSLGNFATKEGVEMGLFLSMICTDEQKISLKKYKADVAKEVFDENRFSCDITMLGEPFRAVLINDGNNWKLHNLEDRAQKQGPALSESWNDSPFGSITE